MSRLSVVAGVFAAISLSTGVASAFITRPHFEATQRGLHDSGLAFTAAAIRRVKISNYLTDRAANWCAVSQELGVADLFCTDADERLIAEAERFHFDELPNAERLLVEYDWLEARAKSAALAARDANDPARLLDVMGITLHAVQDLYSHSTLVDTDLRSWVGEPTRTLDRLPESILSSRTIGYGSLGAGLFSGQWENVLRTAQSPMPYGSNWASHGHPEKTCDLWLEPACSSESSGGLNHDAAQRPRHARALITAIDATREWAQRFRGWVGADFMARAANHGGADFEEDCLASAIGQSIVAGKYGYAEGDPPKLLRVAEEQTSECDDDYMARWSARLHEMGAAASYPDAAAACNTGPLVSAACWPSFTCDSISASWPAESSEWMSRVWLGSLACHSNAFETAAADASFVGDTRIVVGENDGGTLSLAADPGTGELRGTLTVAGVRRNVRGRVTDRRLSIESVDKAVPLGVAWMVRVNAADRMVGHLRLGPSGVPEGFRQTD